MLNSNTKACTYHRAFSTGVRSQRHHKHRGLLTRLHMQGALTGIHGRPRIAARLQCKVSTPGQGWLSGCRSGDWQGDAHSRSQGYSSSSKTKATVLTECSRRNKISARERQGYYNECRLQDRLSWSILLPGGTVTTAGHQCTSRIP